MEAKEFLAQFGHIADAPDGVQHLREMVLALAIKGDLVPRNEGDRPREPDLVAAREWLMNAAPKHSRSRWRKTRDVRQEEHQFELPDHWRWGRVNDLALYTNGLAFKASDWNTSGIPIIRIQNLTDPKKSLNHAQGTFDQSVTVRSGDILVSWSATLGAFVWEGEDAVLNQHIFRVEPCSCLVDKGFLRWVLTWAIRRMEASEAAHGLVMKHINRGPFLAFPVPIPPIAEQKRIVAKVDELMELCDRLEKQQGKARRVQVNLCSSALQRLGEARDAGEFARHWDFVRQNFPLLARCPENIPELRKTILHLAVQGGLSSNMVTWQRGLVGDHVAFLNGYAFKSSWFRDSGVRLVRNKNVGHGTIDWAALACISEERAREFNKWKLAEGDIVLSLDRPLISTGLKVARIRPVDLPCLLLQRVAKPEIRESSLDEAFFFLWLQSTMFCDAINPGRSKGVPHISTRQVEALDMSIPPLAEQKRIVVKVDELMQVCDRLEQQLGEARETAKKLATAAVAAITGTEIKEVPEVKPPKTELITKLVAGKTPGPKAHAPLTGILVRNQDQMSAKALWQRSGLEIDAFYAQLKTEIANGWIKKPETAIMKETEAD
jgi:type I restriction enzyme S subunit